MTLNDLINGTDNKPVEAVAAVVPALESNLNKLDLITAVNDANDEINGLGAATKSIASLEEMSQKLIASIEVDRKAIEEQTVSEESVRASVESLGAICKEYNVDVKLPSIENVTTNYLQLAGIGIEAKTNMLNDILDSITNFASKTMDKAGVAITKTKTAISKSLKDNAKLLDSISNTENGMFDIGDKLMKTIKNKTGGALLIQGAKDINSSVIEKAIKDTSANNTFASVKDASDFSKPFEVIVAGEKVSNYGTEKDVYVVDHISNSSLVVSIEENELVTKTVKVDKEVNGMDLADTISNNEVVKIANTRDPLLTSMDTDSEILYEAIKTSKELIDNIKKEMKNLDKEADAEKLDTIKSNLKIISKLNVHNIKVLNIILAAKLGLSNTIVDLAVSVIKQDKQSKKD